MSDGTEGRIHFIEYEAHNFARIKRTHVFLPERGVIPVTGPNKAGKTSFVRGLAALVGGDGKVIEEPRNNEAPEGEESYLVTRLSTGHTVSRRFTGAASAAKGRLSIKSEDGGTYGQGFLREILGVSALDPAGFFRLKEERQREILLGLAPGLGATLDALNKRKAQVEEERRPHNSEIQRLGRVKEPEGSRPEPVDVRAEIRVLSELQEQKKTREDDVRELARLREAVTERDRAVLGAERDFDVARRKLEEARVEARVAAESEKGFAEAFAKDEDPTPKIVEVTRRIAEADKVAEALRPWNEHDSAQQALVKHREEADRLSSLLEEIDARKTDAIARTALPVSGLTFTPEGDPRLNGAPLSQASGRERAQLTIEIAIAEDPRLGVVLVNGDGIDEEGLRIVDELAVRHDFQVIMDMVHAEGKFASEVRVLDGLAEQATPGAV